MGSMLGVRDWGCGEARGKWARRVVAKLSRGPGTYGKS